LIIPCLINS